MKKVMIIFGTRPEAIKMAPVVLAAKASTRLTPIVCATGQHRGLLDQVTELFGIVPDYDLNLMKPGQDLFDLTSGCLEKLKQVYRETEPDLVLVQGDTTTAFAAALAAFYSRIPVGHVEAGLRTNNIWAPYPEEYNRRAISPLASFHFAPTALAISNLLRENVALGRIFLTGNTSIDALLWASAHLPAPASMAAFGDGTPLVLMTAHRRENFGEPLLEIFQAVKAFALAHPHYRIVYPVHPNPNVLPVAQRELGDIKNIKLVAPVGYRELIFLMQQARFLLTDSGGIQEEAPALGKPTLVLRESTERPEAVEAGCARLVGHDRAKILASMCELALPQSGLYRQMSQARNPFGDGTAAAKIISILEENTYEDRLSTPGTIHLDRSARDLPRPTVH